jgi:hypothetical protein
VVRAQHQRRFRRALRVVGLALLMWTFVLSGFPFRGRRAGESQRPPQAEGEAEARATALLLRMLTPAQREEFEGHGYFTVDVAGRGRFCILPSNFFNVLHIETGDSYCAAPKIHFPLPDLMLCQKLLLENDPERFFKVANRRRELAIELADERLLPEQVLLARSRPSPSRVRWSEISMLPYQNH